MIELLTNSELMSVTNPGIYSGMPMADYLANGCPSPSLSRSVIKSLLYECPAKAYYQRFEAEAEQSNGACNLGTQVHSLILEGIDVATLIRPEDYPGQKGEIPKGWTTKAIKEARDNALAAGKIPMLPDEYDKAVIIAQKAQEQLAGSELGIQTLQAEGWSESVCAWQEGSIWMKTRNDWLSSDFGLILDLKTTALSADPGSYVKQILSSGGDIQAALYVRAIKKLTGKEPKFVFMVLEVEPPYLCSFISLNPQFMDLAERKVEEGIAIWRECLSSGIWLGYPNRVAYLDCPAWALTQFEERKISNQMAAQENGSDDFLAGL
jgi:hypothetical protein